MSQGYLGGTLQDALREELRRQAERDAAVRGGQKAETRRAHGNETRNQDGGDQ